MSQIKDIHFVGEKVETLKNKSKSEQLKIIYCWVKSNHIDAGTFSWLIEYVYDPNVVLR